MYKIDKQSNRIAPLATKHFSDLGFTERANLQEWIANQPEALGEDLLIIQKEFDGFDDTRERLDLLALDKDANLVIIENKLDDTGRDVVWQALKYVSYCSTLNKLQIVEIFQDYLNRFCGGGDAKDLICEFLEVPDLGEMLINTGNDQRLILVAANFRKEVTSTVLWLLSHGIQAQCIKVTPFASGEELFLNVEQIIPTPEAKELMIGMAAKNAEEKDTVEGLKNRHKIRLAFWEMALEAFKNSDCDLFENINPAKDHWLSAGSGVRSMPFSLIFGTKEARVQFNMTRGNAEVNKFVFRQLHARKDQIEKAFGDKLDWRPMENKTSCRIVYRQEVEGYNRDNWPGIIAWMVEKMTALQRALDEPLKQLNKELKNHSQADEDTEA
jgi:hypothetical protein